MTISGDDSGAGGASKKQRIDTDNRPSSSVTNTDSSPQNETLTHKSTADCRFNDAATADVTLRLHFDDQSSPSDRSADSNSAVDQSEVQIYLHSSVLRRSKYFEALLSDRWQVKGQDDDESPSSSENSAKMHRFNFNLAVPAVTGSFDHHLKVLEMLYSEFPFKFDSVASAISILPIALELLFEDCVRECVRFLGAVPWSEDEERRIMDLIPLLNRDEEAKGLVSRVSAPVSHFGIGPSGEMLLGLIDSALYGQPKAAFAKAFVAKIMRDFASKRDAFAVLNMMFEKSLNVMKRCLEDYSSPNFRVYHINEIEGMQKLHLHNAMTHGKNLLWLIERMVELGVADSAVVAWSTNISPFTANLQRALGDDLWRNVAPSLPAVVLRCTSRLASYIVSGNMSDVKQTRSFFLAIWLPVLITCKDRTSPMGPDHKSLYLELEETFLKIISTLSMCEARHWLTECLSFSTRNIDDSPHLVAAFATWFRRVNGPSQPGPSQ